MKRKRFVCEICEKAFRNADDLYDHRQDHHTQAERRPFTQVMAEHFNDLPDGAWGAALQSIGLDVCDLAE